MSADVLAIQARRDAAQVFALGAHQHMSYGEADQALSRLVHALRQGPALAGQQVGVACADPLLFLLLMLALEHLGLVVCPFVHPPDPGMRRALQGCDVFYCSESLNLERPHFEVSLDWLQKVLGDRATASRARAVPRAADAPLHTLMTSGSTGVPQTMVLSRRLFDRRELDRIWFFGLSAKTCFLVAMPLSMGPLYYTVRACLRVGASLWFYDPGLATAQLQQVTHALLLPQQVAHILERLPANYRPNHGLELFVTGARLSPELRHQASARLQARVHDIYGSNESGTVAVMGPQGIGEVLPDVAVQIVDHTDAPLPLGVPGRIRVKTPSLVSAYLDAEQTARRFRHGWFYMGDLGVLHAAAELQVIGRDDHMLNLGGIKISPEEIEDLLRDAHIAADVGVCTFVNSQGLEELYIALERPCADNQNIQALIGRHLGANFGHIRVLQISQVPRTVVGKIQRQQLKTLIQSLLSSR